MAGDRPFALHITWSCYGTWLPGDQRGHVSNILLPEGGFRPKHNVPGTPVSPRDEFTHNKARALQKGETVSLTPKQAEVVAASLCRAAQSWCWRIARGAVISNHVHVVVMDCPNDGPVVRRILKGCSQADLNDHVGQNRRWWTKGGSDRYKNDWPAIDAALLYVGDQPGMLAGIIDGQVVWPAGMNPAARPRMTSARAGVLLLLQRYGCLGYELALPEVHKLLYLLQAAGEKLQLRFTKETTGPCSDNLGNALQRFEGHFTLGFGEGRNAPTTPIKLIRSALKEAEDFAANAEAERRETIERLARVTQLMEGFESPYGLELLARVHWVATHSEEQATDLDSVTRAVYRWHERKRRIIRPELIRIAWERLRDKGWLPTATAGRMSQNVS
jgi:hypothetical protein